MEVNKETEKSLLGRLGAKQQQVLSRPATANAQQREGKKEEKLKRREIDRRILSAPGDFDASRITNSINIKFRARENGISIFFSLSLSSFLVLSAETTPTDNELRRSSSGDGDSERRTEIRIITFLF